MEIMGSNLIDYLQDGGVYVLISYSGCYYHAKKDSAKSTVWRFEMDDFASELSAKNMLEVKKSPCGYFIGLRSHHADGKILQACRDKQSYLRFANYNFDKWEQWTIHGDSLINMLLVNRKFPEKQIEASFEKVLITTEGSLNALLEELKLHFIQKIKDITQSFKRTLGTIENMEISSPFNYSKPETSSKLNHLVTAALTMIFCEASEVIRNQYHDSLEQCSVEYEGKINKTKKKVEDVEFALMQCQECYATYKSDTDKEIASLTCDLQNAKLVAESAMSDQLKLKELEGECSYLQSQLQFSKSAITERELGNKALTEQVRDLTLKCQRMDERVQQLEMLINVSEVKHKEIEEELLKYKALNEAITRREDNLKELFQKVEMELDITRKKAMTLECELNLKEEHAKQTMLEDELINRSLLRSIEVHKVFETVAEKEHNSLLTIEKNDNDFGKQMLKSLGMEDKKAYGGALRKVRDLEMQVRELEKEITCSKDKEVNYQNMIIGLEEKIKNFEEEQNLYVSSLSKSQQKLIECQLEKDIVIDKLREVEMTIQREIQGVEESVKQTIHLQTIQILASFSNKISRLNQSLNLIKLHVKAAMKKQLATMEQLEVAKCLCSSFAGRNKRLLGTNSELELLVDRYRFQLDAAQRKINELKSQMPEQSTKLYISNVGIKPIIQQPVSDSLTFVFPDHNEKSSEIQEKMVGVDESNSNKTPEILDKSLQTLHSESLEKIYNELPLTLQSGRDLDSSITGKPTLELIHNVAIEDNKSKPQSEMEMISLHDYRQLQDEVKDLSRQLYIFHAEIHRMEHKTEVLTDIEDSGPKAQPTDSSDMCGDSQAHAVHPISHNTNVIQEHNLVSIVKSFSSLNEQLRDTIRDLDGRIGLLMQENKDTKTTNLILERKLRDSLLFANLCVDKLMEYRTNKKELPNLKMHRKGMEGKQSTSTGEKRFLESNDKINYPKSNGCLRYCIISFVFLVLSVGFLELPRQWLVFIPSSI